MLFRSALVTKIIGCGGMAKICKFNMTDSLKIGVGMMNRGEVALIVAQKGLDAGLMDAKFFTAVIILIIVSSILTPILLKVLYAKWPDKKDSVIENERKLAQEGVGATYNISDNDFKHDEK